MQSAAFNPWSDFLEGSEQGAQINFAGRVPQASGFRSQDYLQSLFQPTFSRYMGALGRQIQGGQAPTLKFTDFLPQRSFAQRYQAQTPEQRGDFPQRFAPRARWLTGF